MKRNTILIIAGFIIGIILIILLIIYNSKPINYDRVELSTDNFITNHSSKLYLDTVVSVGMDELGIIGCSITIRDMNDQLRNNVGANGLELGAAIFGSGKSYVIYVDPRIDKKNVITVLSHELIHLKQYHSENLIVLDGSKGIVKWKGEEIEVLNLDYNSRPWEIEAFADQKDLANNIYGILLPNN